MTRDASFRDGADKPLRLRALDAEDLAVIAAITQDAVFPVSEMRWDRKARRFALLINRFRWENGRQQPERVQSVLAFEDVMAVQSQGIDKAESDLVCSLLSIHFTPAADGAGRVELTLAGDGAIALQVEALEAVLRDVTQPYAAPSGKAPKHPD
ncbi:DUF2948 family protein [Yoonia vestfoldensis]|jgi:hypothetical protein|uniref:DUF2948 family protein n=1 Tax=Yoonia vestfoldensis TaxID=245188 RepID=A0A1Y0E9D5_9RHOB|nr:DUF2948 family protein [Yoonia vestfoldensis]ARU00216.1 hypothetical protein LOKVESSMR4R_00884 [Yoonia vestfoldensis]